MKRLFLFFFLLLSIPFHTSAISLHKIQDNPQQYQMIYQNSKLAIFVDSDSIESLRYSPPYYTLKCKAYCINYLQGLIILFNININYDISHQYFTPPKRKMSELGIYSARHYKDNWYLNGNYRPSSPFFDTRDCGINSPIYHVANYLFYKAYDEYYGTKFGNTLY